MSRRERLLMDFGWRFHRGEIAPEVVAATAERVRHGSHWLKSGGFTCGGPAMALDDSAWRVVDLPHDFVVEGQVTRPGDEYVPPNDILPVDAARERHMLHGSLPVGVAWYRKAFTVPKGDLGRRVSLEFDGVFRNCTVYLNEHYVGTHLSGYTSFRFDVTDVLRYGERNLLAVRVDATEYEGWFYEGGGIYRHVWLVKTDPLHVAPWGTLVTSELEETTTPGSAIVSARTTVRNRDTADAACSVISAALDAEGRTVATAESTINVPAWDQVETTQQMTIEQPAVWSIEGPNLYTLSTTVKRGAKVVDEYTTPFGIRSIRFDAEKGFFLNGEPVKLKGVCCHQDHAGVGSALPDALQLFRIAQLKAMGCNAYRTAHNPPTPELLDACDRLGMLVMDETRLLSSSQESLDQLTSMVQRDRNHPCVILWSLGNEEWIVQGRDDGTRMAATMKQLVKKLDPSRPVTLAMNGVFAGPIVDVIDVMGFNYHPEVYDDFHKKYAHRPAVVSESASTVTTRGVYADDAARGTVSAYDRTRPQWGDTAEATWKAIAARPWLGGTFVWTGFDYRGEPTPYGWPCVSSHFGILDLCGFPKDNFYFYKARWTDEPMVHLLPHWTWPGREGEPIEVWCHTNCDEVELLLNGASLGRKTLPEYSHVEWSVKYAPGTIEARGSRGGQVVATARVETTGPPTAIRLTPNRATIGADHEDAAVVTVEVVDAEGRRVPTADYELAFDIAGPGRIIGVGNGDPSSHEANKGSVRRAFNGLCQVIVQTTREPGAIQLGASSPDLRDSAVTIRAARCEQRPFVESMR
jgi:beta-galactosidase